VRVLAGLHDLGKSEIALFLLAPSRSVAHRANSQMAISHPSASHLRAFKSHNERRECMPTPPTGEMARLARPRRVATGPDCDGTSAHHHVRAGPRADEWPLYSSGALGTDWAPYDLWTGFMIFAQCRRRGTGRAPPSNSSNFWLA